MEKTEALCCTETAASVSVLSEVISVCEAAQKGSDGRDELPCLDSWLTDSSSIPVSTSVSWPQGSNKAKVTAFLGTDGSKNEAGGKERHKWRYCEGKSKKNQYADCRGFTLS